jgi:hypothetical protein
MIDIKKVENLVAELRKQPDLEKFRTEQGEEFCKRNGINGGQLNFLISVVATERMRKGNIEAKQRIINKRRNNGI